MSVEDFQWWEYFIAAAIVLWAIWAITTIGPVHHCDKCKHWWEAQEGAKIMGGRITEVVDATDMATVLLTNGETALCSLHMLRTLYEKSQAHA